MADYYEDLFYSIVRTDEDNFFDSLEKTYQSKGAVTRWLRKQPTLLDDDGEPMYTIVVWDGYAYDSCVEVAWIPAPLWLQLVAGR